MFLVHSECTKLTANWLNALATALVAAGFFAPVAALVYGISPLAMGARTMVALVLGCLSLGAGLHMIARVVLWRLRE